MKGADYEPEPRSRFAGRTGSGGGTLQRDKDSLPVSRRQHSEKELKRTIAHEIAHIYFDDHKTIGGPAMEERAERQAIAWGF